MSDIDIKIKSSFDASGTDAARKGVEGLGAAGKGGAGLDKVATAAQKAAVENERLASAVAKTATASNQAAVAAQKLATEEQRTAAAASNAAAAQTRAEKAALSLAQANERAANSAKSGAGYFDQMGQAMKGGLLGVVGPAAAATAAIGAVVAVGQSFKDAFMFKAELDATTASVNAQIASVRNSGQVWAEAKSFADRYKLTQQETTNAISASIGVMRASKAPVEDILGVLARMQVLSPEQSLQEAAIALKSLASGDTQSLVTRFEVSRDVANQMKAEIQGGADAVSVMSTFLNQTGISMDVLTSRTQGAAGALKDLARAQEELTLAQGELASSDAGIAVLQTRIETTRMFANTLGANNGALDENANKIFAWLNAMTGTAPVVQAATDATQAHAGALLQSADAEDRRANAARGGIIEQQASTAATINDTMAKQASQAQTQLLEAQIKSVADAYIALNPNIDGAGVASAVAAGKISAAVGTYISMTIATANARAQLAALQNQAGVTPGGGVTEGRSERDTGADRAEAAAAGKGLMRRQADEAAAAKRSQVMAAGTTAQKIALLNQEYQAAVSGHGKESAAAINAQTALLQAQQSGTSKRVAGAGAAATKLESIEQKTGDKLTDIVSKTQDKLIAIDNKAAEARLAAAKRLNEAMAANAVDRRAANEADDLDLIGPMDDKAAAKLNDRERAQASAREREKAAAAEARAGIERGEAETAEKVYAAREEQIQAQQQLDESYYAKQRELADNPEAQAALTQQYDEAVRAADKAAQMRIMFAQAAAEEAAGAAAEEKARIIAEAEEQANQLIGASERSAAGVKKATASARDEAIASIRAIADSINALPAEKRIKISVDGAGSVSTAAAAKSDGAYAGGGSFLTQGPTNITVGDNPGGAELVTVTPLSGSGQTRAAAGTIALAGGGTVLADAGDGYTTPIAGSGSGGGKKGKGGAGGASAAAKDQIAAQKDAIALLSDLIKLRHDMAAELENGTPFDVAFAERLSNAAAAFASFVRTALPASTKAEAEAFKLSADNTKQSIGILADMVDLRKDLADWQSVNPIDLAFVQRLAATAAEVTRIVMGQLVPTTQLEVDRLGRWAELENAAVSLISDVTKLNQRMFSDYVAPSDVQLDMVVKDADRIADRMIVAAKKYDTKGLEAAKLYGDALGGFYGTAKDALLFNQAINSGDFDQNQANLDRFERAAGVAIGVAKRLGAEAATIPSTDLAALQLTTQALAAQSEALIKLAAVPFGDLPGAAANLQSQAAQLLGGAKGGGGATTNVYMTVNALPGMSARDVAAEAVRLLGQQVGSRK